MNVSSYIYLVTVTLVHLHNEGAFENFCGFYLFLCETEKLRWICICDTKIFIWIYSRIFLFLYILLAFLIFAYVKWNSEGFFFKLICSPIFNKTWSQTFLDLIRSNHTIQRCRYMAVLCFETSICSATVRPKIVPINNLLTLMGSKISTKQV